MPELVFLNRHRKIGFYRRAHNSARVAVKSARYIAGNDERAARIDLFDSFFIFALYVAIEPRAENTIDDYIEFFIEELEYPVIYV